MTLDDLAEVYESAVAKRYMAWVNAPEGSDHITNDILRRAGVTAIVRALRDEFVTVFRREYLDDASIETFLSAQVVGMLDKILGDAGEKVAGGSTREDEQSCNSSDGSSPATDAAPAVCVWTKGSDPGIPRHYITACGCTYYPRGYAFCPACKAPITFTEAIMDEAHKELVKRLRGGKCPQCFGFGEVSYGGELVRCSCRDKYEAPISMEYRNAAADALEALAGEVELVRAERHRAQTACEQIAVRLHAAEAERDRLKAALEEIISCGDGTTTCFTEIARKALGDAS